MRQTVSVIFVVLAFGLTAAADEEALKEDLAALQGNWTTTMTGSDGKARVLVKKIKGNKEVYSMFEEAELVLRREVDFTLSRLDNQIRLFTVTRSLSLKGPEEGQVIDVNRSYIYSFENNM